MPPADYKSRVNRNQKKSMPGYIWLLSGLAIGLFVAFIIYLDKQPENDSNFGSAVQHELEKLKKQANKKETKSASAKKLTETKTASAKKEPKFNFYTILPELEVLIPESETRPPDSSNNTAKKQSDTRNSTQYVLQAGSFQNLGDAEKLKANLAFLGIEANIQHVTVNKQSWHRVRTGPYKNKQQLYNSQKVLKKNNIPAISMELK